jgi:3-dehydroquinate dehydratase/shikimate dehydrogenase
MAELVRLRDAVTDADVVEVRLDSVRDPNVSAALAGRHLPVIVTCRPAWEGGAFTGSEEDRKRLLREALDRGAEYVDLEARAGFDDLIASSGGRRVVLSLHDFDGLPADLETRIRMMKSTGAEMVKVAVKTRRLTDCVTLLDIVGRLKVRGVIVIGMGEHGMVTRVLPSRFGSMWSYAGALDGVGQLTPRTLVDEFQFRQRGPETAIYGIAGSPVGHSVSPAMHNAAFRAAGLDAVYLPLPAASAEDFMAFARAFDVKGASVTIPYKVAVFPHIDEPSDLARRIGAINAIKRDDDRWLGENTDAHGFLEPLDKMTLDGARASLLGAGGAARGVAIALASRGARVTVHARNEQRAAEVASLASGAVGTWPPKRGDWDLLVNCTPIGMHPHVDDTPIDAALLGSGTVYDLVYNPHATRLLRESAAAGCTTIGGLEMLVGQARKAFEWWTGLSPSASVMREAATTKLSQYTPQAIE